MFFPSVVQKHFSIRAVHLFIDKKDTNCGLIKEAEEGKLKAFGLQVHFV
jgi:hypothetical protein